MMRQTVTTYNDTLAFGKHKGKTVRWIVDNNPEYIIWLDEESVVEFPEDILETAREEYADNSPPESYFWQPGGDW